MERDAGRVIVHIEHCVLGPLHIAVIWPHGTDAGQANAARIDDLTVAIAAQHRDMRVSARHDRRVVSMQHRVEIGIGR